VIVVVPVTVNAQLPAPEQPAPLQPAKTEPAFGAAASVTTVPRSQFAVQVAPQSIPAGAEVTVPAPVQAAVTVTGNCCSVKVADTVVAAAIVVVQVPEHPPPAQNETAPRTRSPQAASDARTSWPF
jgi:hypothetical protein